LTSGHPSGHVPASSPDLHQTWGEVGGPKLEWIFQNFHWKSSEEVQTSKFKALDHWYLQ
jgi:hypothetical protein